MAELVETDDLTEASQQGWADPARRRRGAPRRSALLAERGAVLISIWFDPAGGSVCRGVDYERASP
jgi:hypothetical protein